MKHMKKFASLMLVLAMLLTLSTTAFAAEKTYSITINNKTEGYTYEAYQIFAGDLTTNTQDSITTKTLSNITWGSSVTDIGKTELLSFNSGAYKNASELAGALNDSNAPAFAAEAAKYLGTAAGTATAFSNGTYTISNLQPGYYLIQNRAVPDKDSAYTGYILQVVGDVTVTPKSAVPTVDKQVQDETVDAETGADSNGWGETADHDIGETFQFKLIAKIPNEDAIDAYESYKLVFHDTMSKGVTFEKVDKVTVNGKKIDAKTEDTPGYELKNENNANGTTSLTVTIADLKQHVTGSIKDATVVITYNAHLNGDAVIGNHDDNKNTVYLEYSNNPHSNATGKTVTDTVYVFTYELVNTKVIGGTGDENTPPTPLQGAGFKLKNAAGKWYQINEKTKAVSWVDEESDGSEIKSDGNGKFIFSGLDVGTYTLKETTTPPGYNTCADKEVVIAATHAENDTGASSIITINGEDAVGVTVENVAGSHLPSTGGMGTTIFYVTGVLLLIIVGILLLIRRRTNCNK